MDKQFIDLYAPENAKQLSKEDRAALSNLSKSDIQALAEAHPNKGNQIPYLVFKDKTKEAKDQLYQRGTWANLLALWNLGQTKFVVADFVEHFNPKAEEVKVAPAQDLTQAEARTAPGLKTAKEQTGKNTRNTSNADEQEEGTADEDENIKEAAAHAKGKRATKGSKKK